MLSGNLRSALSSALNLLGDLDSLICKTELDELISTGGVLFSCWPDRGDQDDDLSPAAP